jgi:hypothetical protein
MKIEFVPLLQLQRDLHSIPWRQERFHAYLETIINADGSDLEVPPLAARSNGGMDLGRPLIDGSVRCLRCFTGQRHDLQFEFV